MKKYLVLIVLVLSLFPGLAGKTQGNTYHVDPSGSDTTGDGSLAHPWASITHAAAQVQAGDTVLVHPGIYSGGIHLTTGGTALEPITFSGTGPGVIIHGSGGQNDAFYIEFADYVVVENLTIRNANRAGLRLSNAHHVTIRNCVFANNTTWGMFTDFSDYTTVEDSEAYGSQIEHGIYISNSSDYPVIRRNRLHDNHACGLHMNGDLSMGPDGTISHALVEGNIIYNNGVGGGSGINGDGIGDAIIRNNLLYNNHASGISLYQIDGALPAQNNLVANNTILMPADGRWGLNIMTSNNNRLYNNIVYSAHTYRGSISVTAPIHAGFKSDYNIVVNRFTTDEGGTILNLAGWQALGYDTHSLLATPEQLFVQPAANDYHLKSGSPAVDAGTAQAGVTSDLDGNPRPFGTGYDIGAYELTPSLLLQGSGLHQSIHLSWQVNTPLNPAYTWQISYTGPSGDEPSPISGIGNAVRAYDLTGLANGAWYSVTLNAMDGPTPVLTATVSVLPGDHALYLPVIRK